MTTLAVYNCTSCGRMTIGKYGPKNPKQQACKSCMGSYERNDVATNMLGEKYQPHEKEVDKTITI